MNKGAMITVGRIVKEPEPRQVRISLGHCLLDFKTSLIVLKKICN